MSRYVNMNSVLNCCRKLATGLVRDDCAHPGHAWGDAFGHQDASSIYIAELTCRGKIPFGFRSNHCPSTSEQRLHKRDLPGIPARETCGGS